MSLYQYTRIQGWMHPADAAEWRANGRRRDAMPPVTAAWRVTDTMSNVSPGIVYLDQRAPAGSRSYLVVPAGSTMPREDSPGFRQLRDAAHALARYADTGDDRYLYGVTDGAHS
jgi:hypothetical protein